MAEKKCLDVATITFDPNMFIPFGMQGELPPDSGGEGPFGDYESKLPSPFFYIVSQTERDIGSGYIAVDVVFEIEPVDGATTYELRISKT